MGRLVASFWAPGKGGDDGESEIVSDPGLELFPSAKGSAVKVANRIEEMDDSKTWVLVHRDNGTDDCTLAWSPCDGERLMIPEQLIGSHGLRLAPSCHEMGPFSLLLDRYHDQLYVAYEGSHGCFLYVSSTGSWQPLLDVGGEKDVELELMDAQEVREIGNTYIPSVYYNPKNQSYKRLPAVPDNVRLKGVHWHEGSFYMMSCIPFEEFQVFSWQGGEEGWQKVAAHPIYQDGVDRVGGDLFWFTAGGRYACISQGNMSYPDIDSGRFIVVYDLEERQWHYHTMHADSGFGIPNVVVCNRVPELGDLEATTFNAVWAEDRVLLQLPPISSA